MALPVQHGEAHTTTLGSDPVTIGLGSAFSAGDLVTVVLGTDDNTVPSFVVNVTGTGGTLTTEDETIAHGNNGTIVYKDGGGSTVAYDSHSSVSGANEYIWSFLVTADSLSGTQGLNVVITYGGTSGGSARRTQIVSHTPGSGDSWDTPRRASLRRAHCQGGPTSRRTRRSAV